MLTHLSLFSGIGGLDLAAEWAGFTTVGQCEFADYPTKILEKHWPEVARWRDIRTLTKESFYERTGLRTVDVISGGFPCQPFSVAGKQKGKGDDRYLWPEMLRIIRELAPRWVVGENVPGILRIAGRTVCEDLEREGYAVTVFNFEAAAVGAPHRRERVFFIANAKSQQDRWLCQPGLQPNAGTSGKNMADTDATWKLQSQGFFRALRRWSCDSGKDVADSDNEGLQRRERDELPECSGERLIGTGGALMADNDGERLQTGMFAGNRGEQATPPQHNGSPLAWHGNGGIGTWWRVEPDVGRVANGVPSRVDRLKCLGNAVVPQQAYPIFAAIAEIERSHP